MVRRLDRYWVGLVIGLVLPAVFGVSYIRRMGLWPALRSLGWDNLGVLPTQLLLVAVFPDLAAIFLFYTMDAWRASKGMLLAAMLWLMAGVVMVSG